MLSSKDLGDLYAAMGRFVDAEASHLRGYTIARESLDPSDIDVIPTLSGLGAVYARMGKLERAEPLLARALSMWQATQLAPDSPLLVRALTDYAGVLRKLKRDVEAEKLEQQLRQARPPKS